MTAYKTLLAEAKGRPFAAIVGWPVDLSRSPALHGFWLKQQGIDGHYGRLPIEPKRAALEELVAFLKKTPNARGVGMDAIQQRHDVDLVRQGEVAAARGGRLFEERHQLFQRRPLGLDR